MRQIARGILRFFVTFVLVFYDVTCRCPSLLIVRTNVAEKSPNNLLAFVFGNLLLLLLSELELLLFAFAFFATFFSWTSCEQTGAC